MCLTQPSLFKRWGIIDAASLPSVFSEDQPQKTPEYTRTYNARLLSCRSIFRMSGFNLRNVLLVLGCVFLGGHVWADVWKYVDDKGVTQFTNEPPPKQAKLVIQSGGVPVRPQLSKSESMPDGSARTTVAVMHTLPAYKAAQGSVNEASEIYGVNANLIKAVVATESAFNPIAVSNKGAVGLMQVMPDTAKRYGVQSDRGASISAKLTDPELNIHTGTRYLADLLRQFGGQTELALAAYNAGEGAVARAGNRIPNFKETQAYVQKVMGVYRVLQARAG
ncbi:MAG: lytic transglycosylase [Comamonadaceae bacterium]|nr:MAG: lytic transglycosylase [Comamonadaceae bacterium]